MSALRAAVHVAAPTPFQNPGGGSEGEWSPISCTLIYSDHDAVLVDTPITIKQTNALIDWIAKIAPDCKLSYIYITHGHGDHWFGLPLLLQRWPEAVPIATAGTIKHMEETVIQFDSRWGAMFPQQIYQPLTLARPLPKDAQFTLEGKTMHAIECGHTDTHNTTILWVPELRLVVGGDVVYGGCHQMLAFANTQAKRDEWIRAIEKVEALSPMYVVPGHKLAEEMDGIWHLARTKQYIQDFGKVMDTNPKSPQDIFDQMVKIHPHRFNPWALRTSCQGSFKALKGAKM